MTNKISTLLNWAVIAVLVTACGSEFATRPCDNACATNATCAENSSGGECVCDDGFVGDGITCDNIDECADGTHDCAPNASCMDTPGAFECACADGILGDGTMCVELSVVPPSAIVSKIVTVHGAGFGDTAGSLTFGGRPADTILWSDEAIQAVVPDVYPGVVDIIITPQGQEDLHVPFSVLLPPRVFLGAGADVVNGNNALIVFDYDPITKQLTEAPQSPIELGSPASLAQPFCRSAVVVHRGTRRVFAVSEVSLDIFDMDPVSGALTAVAGSPLALRPGGQSVAVNDTGERVFAMSVASPSSGMAVFDLQPDGSFSEAKDSPTDILTGNSEMAVSDDGAFAFIFGGSFAYSYVVGALNGGLSGETAIPGGGAHSAVRHRPNTNQLVHPVGSEFKISTLDATAGTLSPIAGSPFSVAVNSPSAAFASDGARLFLGERSLLNPGMVVYDLATDGTPTEVAGSPYSLDGIIGTDACMFVSQDGDVLIAGSSSGESVGVYTLAPTGKPTPVESGPFTYATTNTDPSSMAISF